nr:MAG TPA: hypothetical protein [Crassvirales sp.]
MDTNLEKMFLIRAQSLLFQKRNLTLRSSFTLLITKN